MADIIIDQFDYAYPPENIKSPQLPDQDPKPRKPEHQSATQRAVKPALHPGMFQEDRSWFIQFLRITGVGLFASTAAFFTFLICTGLIDFSDGARLNLSPSFRMIDVVEDIPEIAPRPVERQIKKMVDVELPPDLPKIEEILTADTGLSTGIDLTISAPSRVKSRLSMPSMQMATTLADGNYMPLVRIQPQYPRRALQKRIQGYVVIELTVASDGTVRSDSIRVLDAEPKGIFDTAAIQAATKFKYRPKVVNGKGVDVPHVTYRFTFELANRNPAPRQGPTKEDDKR